MVGGIAETVVRFPEKGDSTCVAKTVLIKEGGKGKCLSGQSSGLGVLALVVGFILFRLSGVIQFRWLKYGVVPAFVAGIALIFDLDMASSNKN